MSARVDKEKPYKFAVVCHECGTMLKITIELLPKNAIVVWVEPHECK